MSVNLYRFFISFTHYSFVLHYLISEGVACKGTPHVDTIYFMKLNHNYAVRLVYNEQ
jgi:hypothetical protein